MVTEASILAHYKQSLKTMMETDFSNYINSGVLSQLGENVLLHFITFFSKNLNLIKYKYEIYD